MATERAQMDAESWHIRAEDFRLSLDQDASNALLRRRQQTRLPLQYEARNLLNTPGAGPSNPPGTTRAVEVPGSGAVAQPQLPDLPRRDQTPSQQFSTPPGHILTRWITCYDRNPAGGDSD